MVAITHRHARPVGAVTCSALEFVLGVSLLFKGVLEVEKEDGSKVSRQEVRPHPMGFI